jgi:hypothetical protein
MSAAGQANDTHERADSRLAASRDQVAPDHVGRLRLTPADFGRMTDGPATRSSCSSPPDGQVSRPWPAGGEGGLRGRRTDNTDDQRASSVV